MVGIDSVAKSSAQLANFRSDGFDTPGTFMAEISIERDSARVDPCPKVSLASLMRWGTEPEGWYVEHPDAVFDVRRELLPFGVAPAYGSTDLSVNLRITTSRGFYG
jgi:hypothetical protein